MVPILSKTYSNVKPKPSIEAALVQEMAHSVAVAMAAAEKEPGCIGSIG